ncbi:MAG: trigger factor family protein, partial [Peptococcaceae bacterium]|nr:trigger factor family protein [Peptococcaceae bacterium]
MKVNAETLEGNRAKLTVEVPHEDFELSMDRAYRGAVKQLNIPGFRKGKAPRYIVERLYGREILLEDAVKEAVPEAFSQALAEVGDQYECLGYPEYDGILTEKGQGLTFTATYDLRPEVRLGEYKGAALPKLPETPAADALDKRLAAMRDRYARIETVDG